MCDYALHNLFYVTSLPCAVLDTISVLLCGEYCSKKLIAEIYSIKPGTQYRFFVGLHKTKLTAPFGATVAVVF